MNHPFLFFQGQKIMWASLQNDERFQEGKKKSDNAPVVVMQRSPICSEEVRDHQYEALSLWSWGHILPRAGPINFSLVILVKSQFIVSDKDEAAKVADCTINKQA